jgi:peptide/nickel transport system ATP-binding protein
MLSVKDVKAYYGASAGIVRAVDGVTLDVLDDEILGIAGESGCGKSTLIKVMYGAVRRPLEIVSGEVEVCVKDTAGRDLRVKGADLPKIWWRYISYIPQGSMSVLNPVVHIESQFMDAVPASYRELNDRVTHADLVAYLKELDLPPTVLQSYPHQLSGGMRQRVIVALATFLHPAIVLADEPTTALDVVVQRGILTMLTRLQNRMQNTVVIVSHDMGVHYQITHRMAIMYAGKIVELGSTDTVFNRPYHPYTEMLIKSLPRVGDRSVREGISGSPPSLIDPPKGCRFADRCPHVMPICTETEPVLSELETQHRVACHLFAPGTAERKN